MVSSLAQQLMARLRRRSPNPSGTSAAELPATPTLDELRHAAAAARSGRRSDCARYAAMLLAVDTDPTATTVKQTAEDLLIAASPDTWRNLDLAARPSWQQAPAWSVSAHDRVAAGHAGLLGLVVASFHPSGYVREAAVARLGELPGPLSARALTLRTSDWVPQVRDRARAAIEQHLTSANGLLTVGGLAEGLGDRLHGRWLANRFEHAVATLGDDDLARLCAAADWRLRRAAYRVALAEDRLGLAQLVAAAEHDGDLVIRTQCADSAIRAATAADDLDRVRPLANSGTAAVRASAVGALARAGDIGAALAALPDRNPVVREVAQAAARRQGIDLAGQYRDLVVATDPSDPGGIAGLGETGTGVDAELVRRALVHPLPRGRVEAIRALRRLGAISIDVLVAMLQDPAPAVTRQAALSLRPNAGKVPLNRLEPLLSATNARHVRNAAYRVLHDHGTWTRLRADLELYDDLDESLRNRVRGDIAGWLSGQAATTYSVPTGDAADRLDRLLTRSADSLGPGRERLLRFHLGLSDRARPGAGLMDTVVDIDAVAQEFTARRPQWAARGIHTAELTWRDATAGWPQPLRTDRASVADPESVGLSFSERGEEVARLVIWRGGWADLEVVVADELVIETPEFTSVAEAVATAEDLVARLTAS